MLEKHMGIFPKYKRNELAAGPSFHQYYDKCFAVTAEHFEGLLKDMQHGIELNRPNQPAVVDVRAMTHGGEVEFDSLTELLAYGNEPKDRLHAVGLGVRSHDESLVSLVRFQDYFPGWSVSVIVEGGDEQASLGLFQKIVKSIEPAFKWYSFLLSTRFWVGLALLVIVAYTASLLGRPVAQQLEAPPPQAVEVAPTAAASADHAAPAAAGGLRVTVIEFAIFGVIAIAFSFVVLPYLFPRGLCLIGREIKRAAVVSRLRWALLLVLILLPVGVIALSDSQQAVVQ